MNDFRPRLAVTMGDPAGVGPEICLDLLASEAWKGTCVPIIFGDRAVLERCAAATGKLAPGRFVREGEMEGCDGGAVFDIPGLSLDDFVPGSVNAATGRAGYGYLVKAIDLAMGGAVEGVVTCPLQKEALRAAGIPHPGHTEIIAERTGSRRVCMMLTSDVLTCSFVTVHVGYHEVPGLLSIERIQEVIELTREAMWQLRGREPKLLVCGLNPHAGEHGLFGNGEEERLIAPAMERARAGGADLEGPLPPDTAFLERRRAETDAVVCMYHDQGHIPLKALAFDRAVNVTLGLPIVRTSVDHGTALDIAWQGKANPRSLFEAVALAGRMAVGRRKKD